MTLKKAAIRRKHGVKTRVLYSTFCKKKKKKKGFTKVVLNYFSYYTRSKWFESGVSMPSCSLMVRARVLLRRTVVGGND